MQFILQKNGIHGGNDDDEDNDDDEQRVWALIPHLNLLLAGCLLL